MGGKNHLNVDSSSNSILELQFLRGKNRQISVANITFKLLKRNIKLLGVGKGILKIENSLHLKAVRKTSPWFLQLHKQPELTLMTVCEGELLYFLHI